MKIKENLMLRCILCFGLLCATTAVFAATADLPGANTTAQAQFIVPAVAAADSDLDQVGANKQSDCSLPADGMTREHLAPAGRERSYHNTHYSPVVKIGNRVIVSGIPASRGATDEEKIRWAFQQLDLHLQTAGASLADVVALDSFHVAADHAQLRRHMEIVLRVHHEFFKDLYPAWTATGTSALFAKDAPMEIRAEAIIGSGQCAKAEIPKPH